MLRYNAYYPNQENTTIQNRITFRKHEIAGNLNMKVYRTYNQYDEELRSYIDYNSSVDGTILAVNVPFKVIPVQP